MIKLKTLIETKNVPRGTFNIQSGPKVKDIEFQISKLEKEYDAIDHTGAGYERQRQIGAELLKLRNQKSLYDKLRSAVNNAPDNGSLTPKINPVRESTLLTEVHLEDLFHATYNKQLESMMKQKVIKLAYAGGTDADQALNKGYPFFLSTMRQKYGNFVFNKSTGYPNTRVSRNVVINLNGQSLTAAGYKIFPVDYWGQGREQSEQEERIVSNNDEIPLDSKFVKSIHVYVDPKDENLYVKESLLEIDKLAHTINVPVYFYTPEHVFSFKSHRTKNAIRTVKDIISPPEWSPEDLEYNKRTKARYNSPQYRADQELKLRIFLDIYNEEEIDVTKYPGKNIMSCLLYYPHDAHAVLKAEVHNLKGNHPLIFREIVQVMKENNFKTFGDLINFVIKREQNKEKVKQDEWRANYLKSLEKNDKA